jgi:hypothetical protein
MSKKSQLQKFRDNARELEADEGDEKFDANKPNRWDSALPPSPCRLLLFRRRHVDVLLLSRLRMRVGVRRLDDPASYRASVNGLGVLRRTKRA